MSDDLLFKIASRIAKQPAKLICAAIFKGSGTDPYGDLDYGFAFRKNPIVPPARIRLYKIVVRWLLYSTNRRCDVPPESISAWSPSPAGLLPVPDLASSPATSFPAS
jgi:hypothetical protein